MSSFMRKPLLRGKKSLTAASNVVGKKVTDENIVKTFGNFSLGYYQNLITTYPNIPSIIDEIVGMLLKNNKVQIDIDEKKFNEYYKLEDLPRNIATHISRILFSNNMQEEIATVFDEIGITMNGDNLKFLKSGGVKDLLIVTEDSLNELMAIKHRGGATFRPGDGVMYQGEQWTVVSAEPNNTYTITKRINNRNRIIDNVLEAQLSIDANRQQVETWSEYGVRKIKGFHLWETAWCIIISYLLLWITYYILININHWTKMAGTGATWAKVYDFLLHGLSKGEYTMAMEANYRNITGELKKTGFVTLSYTNPDLLSSALMTEFGHKLRTISIAEKPIVHAFCMLFVNSVSRLLVQVIQINNMQSEHRDQLAMMSLGHSAQFTAELTAVFTALVNVSADANAARDDFLCLALTSVAQFVIFNPMVQEAMAANGMGKWMATSFTAPISAKKHEVEVEKVAKEAKDKKDKKDAEDAETRDRMVAAETRLDERNRLEQERQAQEGQAQEGQAQEGQQGLQEAIRDIEKIDGGARKQKSRRRKSRTSKRRRVSRRTNKK